MCQIQICSMLGKKETAGLYKGSVFRKFLLYLSSISWVLIDSSSLLAASQSIDIQTAVGVIREFEAASQGVAITYGAKFYESESNKPAAEGDSDFQFYLARDAKGPYCNFYHEGKTNAVKGETIFTADQHRFHAVGSMVTVRQNDTSGFLRENIYITPIVGASLSDQAFYSEILEHALTKLTLNSVKIEGLDCWLLNATNAILGEYKFWISANPELRLIRVEISKSAHHEIRTVDGQRKKLGDPYPVDPKRLKEIPKDKHSAYLASLKSVPSLESEIYCFEQYAASPNGGSFPRLITKGNSSTVGNKVSFLGLSYSISNIEPFVIDDPLRAKFRQFVIPNGKNVTVVGQEGLAWKYDNGKIVRVVDTDSIDSVNGVRFRKPQTQYGYYIVFAATLSLVTWVIYRRWKSVA